MGSNNTLGMQNSECTDIISSLKSAIDMAGNDLDYIVGAEYIACGCRTQAVESICKAKKSIELAKKEIEKFKQDFEKYCKNVSDADEEMHKSFRKLAGALESLAEIGTNKKFGYLSTGKDGAIGVVRDIARTASLRGCKVIEKDGYYIIKGVPNSRKGISALKDLKGTRYKVGSDKFFESGMYKYLPEGASLEEGISKFGSNVGRNIKNGFDGFGGNTFVFKEGETLGNAAKGLGYLSVAAGVGKGIYENYEKGADAGEYTADIVCDTAKGLGSMAAASAGAEVGFAIGSAIPIPVVGSVAGAALGFAGGYIGSELFNGAADLASKIEIGGKPIGKAINETIDHAVDGIWNGIKSLF